MFRGSTNGSSNSDEEIHGGVRGDHGYVTQSEFVGLRHLVRDGLGRYERRLQTHDANFNQINANIDMGLPDLLVEHFVGWWITWCHR